MAGRAEGSGGCPPPALVLRLIDPNKRTCPAFFPEYHYEHFTGPKIVVQAGENDLGDTIPRPFDPFDPKPNDPAAERAGPSKPSPKAKVQRVTD